jgi:hypothetical protein
MASAQRTLTRRMLFLVTMIRITKPRAGTRPTPDLGSPKLGLYDPDAGRRLHPRECPAGGGPLRPLAVLGHECWAEPACQCHWNWDGACHSTLRPSLARRRGTQWQPGGNRF